MKIAKFISICIFITFCSCNNKGVYENCISFKLKALIFNFLKR